MSLLLAWGIGAAMAYAAAAQAVQHPRDTLIIVVPAPEGGSWDQTAKAMKQALVAGGLVRDVEIVWRPGGAGLVGLSEFIEGRRGDPNVLLIGGSPIVLAAKAQVSVNTLLDTTPLARLIGSYTAIAVPNASPLRRADQLAPSLRDPGGGFHWVVSPAAGSTDEQLARFVTADAGADPNAMVYRAVAGAAYVPVEVARGDPQLIGAAPYGVFAPYAAAGRLRILAVAAPGEQVRGIPTLRAVGIDREDVPWTGVFAAPGLDAAQRGELEDMITKMARGPVWRRELEGHNWVDFFLGGEQFRSLLVEEHEAAAPQIAAGTNRPRRAAGLWSGWRVLVAALGAFSLLAGAAAAIFWRRMRALQRRDIAVRQELSAIENLEPATGRSQVQEALVASINREFDGWKLSPAERDVAWFMLKGLPLRDIAKLRGTSERTVSQQAQSIYGKAGLDGRSDLAGHILDQCLLPGDGSLTARRTSV